MPPGADVDALCAALLHDDVVGIPKSMSPDIEGQFGPSSLGLSMVFQKLIACERVAVLAPRRRRCAKTRSLLVVVIGGFCRQVVWIASTTQETLDAVGRSKMRRVALETYQIFFLWRGTLVCRDCQRAAGALPGALHPVAMGGCVPSGCATGKV